MKTMLTLIGIMISCSCGADRIPGNGKNPAAVAQVAAGKLTEANASWWGFDREESTAALQQAIDSKATKVVVPDMGAPWMVQPITLRGNLELVFESGVLLLAKQGEFKERHDSLVSADGQSDIIIRGNGAVWRMRKKDYANPPYPPNEEWRHGLNLLGCKRVLVEGLRIESSGGDGFYIGGGGGHGCEDIVIRDCVAHDHYRQGISVTGVRNLLVEDCVFSGTDGTGPAAGIDFEPNHARQPLVNCVIRNCTFENNSGHGMFVRPHDSVDSESQPVSIRFENCVARMDKPGTGGDCGMVVRLPGDQGPAGLIEFINCTSENTGQAGANLYGESVGNVKVRFSNCTWKNSAGTAMVLSMQRPSSAGKGGVEFVNCSVYEEKTGPTVQVISEKGGDYGQDFKGTITVHNKHGGRIGSEPRGVNVNLSIVDGKSGTLISNSGTAEVTGRIVGARDRRAVDLPGYDDGSTFGELWATHDFIADLPKVWRFRLDFKDEGQERDWGGVIVDQTQWQPIKIGEWWEPQGHQYDGIAWYRVEFEVPASAKGKKLSLAFGAVDESAWVYLNGKPIGEHDAGDGGWNQRFEIPLGDAVKFGATNVLAVRVRDRGNYGGIWKSVKLVAKKK